MGASAGYQAEEGLTPVGWTAADPGGLRCRTVTRQEPLSRAGEAGGMEFDSHQQDGVAREGGEMRKQEFQELRREEKERQREDDE